MTVAPWGWCTHRMLHPEDTAPWGWCTHRMLHLEDAAPWGWCTHRMLHPQDAATWGCCTLGMLHQIAKLFCLYTFGRLFKNLIMELHGCDSTTLMSLRVHWGNSWFWAKLVDNFKISFGKCMTPNQRHWYFKEFIRKMNGSEPTTLIFF